MKSRKRMVTIVASGLGIVALAALFAKSRSGEARRGSPLPSAATRGGVQVRRIPPVEVAQQDIADNGLSARPTERFGDVSGRYEPSDPDDLGAAFLARAIQAAGESDDSGDDLADRGLHIEADPASEEVADLDATLSFGFSEQDLEILSTENDMTEDAFEDFGETDQDADGTPEPEPWYAEIREPRRVSRPV